MTPDERKALYEHLDRIEHKISFVGRSVVYAMAGFLAALTSEFTRWLGLPTVVVVLASGVAFVVFKLILTSQFEISN